MFVVKLQKSVTSPIIDVFRYLETDEFKHQCIFLLKNSIINVFLYIETDKLNYKYILLFMKQIQLISSLQIL